MLVPLKTMAKEAFTIEMEPSQTILELKQKIAEHRGETECPVGNQKLIFHGKILEDEKTIDYYKLDLKNHVALMVTKPVPPAAATARASLAAASQPAAAARASSAAVARRSPTAAARHSQAAADAARRAQAAIDYMNRPTRRTTTATTTTTTTTSTITTTAANTTKTPTRHLIDLETLLANRHTCTVSEHEEYAISQPESHLVRGQAYNRVVNELIAMGFGLSEVSRAIRVSYHNPERAVEYLLEGIPENLREMSEGLRSDPEPAVGEDQPPTPSSTDHPMDTAPADGDTFEDLLSQPGMTQLRDEILRNSYNMIESLLDEICYSNPDLLEVIEKNQLRFKAMLRACGIVTVVDDDYEASAAEGGGTLAQELLAEIQITAEDRQAIDKLVALGLPEDVCMQAYFVCEKDEKLAAEFLFS